MPNLFAILFKVELTVSISPNRIAIRDPKSGRSAAVTAPFSCSHQLVSDPDLFEETLRDSMREIGCGGWLIFPRLAVSIEERQTHPIERRVIRDLALNAGASDVFFERPNDCWEEQAEREKYVRAKMANR